MNCTTEIPTKPVKQPAVIIGKLVEAGNIEGLDGFTGLLIEVSIDDLKKATNMPLYQQVLVASLT